MQPRFPLNSVSLTEAASLVAMTAARATSTKKAKPRARHTKRTTIKRKRKHTLSKRRWHAAPATASHRCKWRKRRCRTRSPSDEAYIPRPRENSLMLAYRPEPTAPPTLEHRLHDPAPSPSPDSPTDIVEREDDIPLIVQIAQTLAGAHVEHALSIVEVRDTRTGQISYRIVSGDESKRTPDMAELPDVVVRPNERIVADIHSHPEFKAQGGSVADKLIAARATETNMYPGNADYAAVESRGVVSAILNPNGTVLLLRRLRGAPSVRVIDGPPLPPLQAARAQRLDLVYLYSQGYLADGNWTRPTIEQAAHAAADANPAQSRTFVTPVP